MRKLLATLLSLALLGASVPLLAQDTDLSEGEQAYITIVADAQAAISELDTYAANIQIIQAQTITQTGGFSLTVETRLVQDTDSIVRNNPDGTSDSYAYLEQTFTTTTGGQTDESALTMEMIIIDGGFYMRFNDIPAAAAPLFPTGWVDVARENVPGLEAIDTRALADMSGSNLISQYPVRPETVAQIDALEPITVNGQTFERYIISFRPEAVAEVIYNSYINFEAMTAEESALIDQMLPNTTVTQESWVGAEDGLLYRLVAQVTIAEFESEIDSNAFQLAQESEITVALDDFNEPVDIDPPPLD